MVEIKKEHVLQLHWSNTKIQMRDCQQIDGFHFYFRLDLNHGES